MNAQSSSGRSSPHAGAVVVLDMQALARLNEIDPDGRHGVVMRVLGAFEKSLAVMLAQLAAGRGEGATALVAGLAHTFKSSSASVGAMALAAACMEVERRQRGVPGGVPEALDSDVQTLLDEGHAALAAVRSMLQS